MERLTERNPAWIYDELWENACEPDCEEIDAVYRKLKEYEDLEEQGRLLILPCKVKDTVYEICFCDDGEYHMFPMIVKAVCKYGAVRAIKGKTPTVWNIYAESENSTYMYKSFYDIGSTLFLAQSEAEAKLKELRGEEDD